MKGLLAHRLSGCLANRVSTHKSHVDGSHLNIFVRWHVHRTTVTTAW